GRRRDKGLESGRKSPPKVRGRKGCLFRRNRSHGLRGGCRRRGGSKGRFGGLRSCLLQGGGKGRIRIGRRLVGGPEDLARGGVRFQGSRMILFCLLSTGGREGRESGGKPAVRKTRRK